MKIDKINSNLINEEKLQRLTPREQKIFQIYFGLDGFKRHTLREMGKMLGISGERIR